MSVTAAIEQEIAKLPDDLADSTFAALALQLAREMDDPGNSATSKSMVGKVLFDLLLKLRDLAPKKQERDGIDQLADRRKQRIARGATAADLSRP